MSKGISFYLRIGMVLTWHLRQYIFRYKDGSTQKETWALTVLLLRIGHLKNMYLEYLRFDSPVAVSFHGRYVVVAVKQYGLYGWVLSFYGPLTPLFYMQSYLVQTQKAF